jgi:hypothetical protein
MIIVKLQGGLGNQMFQYALYKKLSIIGKCVKIDLQDYEKLKMHNGYELEKVFNIKASIANTEEVNTLKDSNKSIYNKFRRKLFGVKKSNFVEEYFKYYDNLWEMDDVYLDGYWQSAKYFQDIREHIVNDFKVDLSNDIKNNETIDIMNKSNSVSIHFRRGDYISNPEAAKVHGGITTIQYYKNAIEKISKSIDNPKFFVFSDDIEWVVNNFNIPDSKIIDWNIGEDSYKDLILMSMCKHNIMANSSFSWWGAWLNSNEDKVVIIPNKWANGFEAAHVACPDWICLDTENIIVSENL